MGALDVEVGEYKAFTARLKGAEKTVRASRAEAQSAT